MTEKNHVIIWNYVEIYAMNIHSFPQLQMIPILKQLFRDAKKLCGIFRASIWWWRKDENKYSMQKKKVPEM
jgi:hypothetical protein